MLYLLLYPLHQLHPALSWLRVLQYPSFRITAAFATALGQELDLMGRGMGMRSQRYALVAKDGKVTHLGLEAPGGFEASKAETILGVL